LLNNEKIPNGLDASKAVRSAFQVSRSSWTWLFFQWRYEKRLDEHNVSVSAFSLFSHGTCQSCYPSDSMHKVIRVSFAHYKTPWPSSTIHCPIPAYSNRMP